MELTENIQGRELFEREVEEFLNALSNLLKKGLGQELFSHLNDLQISRDLSEFWKKISDGNIRSVFLNLFPLININEVNQERRNVLHYLASKLSQFPFLGGLWKDSLIPLIISPLNVNSLDEDFETPFTLILRGKLCHPSNKNTFEEIEETFARHGANYTEAEKWIQHFE